MQSVNHHGLHFNYAMEFHRLILYNIVKWAVEYLKKSRVHNI